jgi:ketosteroid isomerase-like protein
MPEAYHESGGQNAGLSDLVEHHVEPEGDALDSLELTFSNVETYVEGDFAWAIASTEVKATVKSNKREIHNRGYETFLFRQVNGEWKVVHTHSSSRPVTKETGH